MPLSSLLRTTLTWMIVTLPLQNIQQCLKALHNLKHHQNKPKSYFWFCIFCIYESSLKLLLFSVKMNCFLLYTLKSICECVQVFLNLLSFLFLRNNLLSKFFTFETHVIHCSYQFLYKLRNKFWPLFTLLLVELLAHSCFKSIW